MLAPDVSFEGYTHRQWVLLLDTFRRAPAARDAALPAVESSGGVVAVTTGSKLRKLVSTRSGRLDVRSAPWPEPLESLAARHSARWAAVIATGALEEAADRFAERLARGQDLSTQLLELVAVLRELEHAGALTLWPRPLRDWPVPTERALLRGLDLLCPPERALVLGVFDAGELATCLVARRGARGFDRIVGPDELRHEMGLLSGDFRRDYRHLASAVEGRIAKVAVGCYGELETFRRLSAGDVPGAWAAAVAARQVVVSPITPGVAVPLGLDAGRVAFRELCALASRLGANEWLSKDGPFAQALAGVERPVWLERDAREVLGFDPFRLLAGLFAKDAEH